MHAATATVAAIPLAAHSHPLGRLVDDLPPCLEGVSRPIASQGAVEGHYAPGCILGCFAEAKDGDSFKVDIEGHIVTTVLAATPVAPAEKAALDALVVAALTAASSAALSMLPPPALLQATGDVARGSLWAYLMDTEDAAFNSNFAGGGEGTKAMFFNPPSFPFPHRTGLNFPEFSLPDFVARHPREGLIAPGAASTSGAPR